MRLAVTGATGFVGKRFVQHALEVGAEIVALVRNPAVCTLPRHPLLVVEGWRLGEPLPATGRVDAVCHFAAYIPANFDDPGEARACFETNTLSVLGLVADSAAQGAGHFVYLSSGQIYRPGGPAADELAATYPVERATYYLTSKLAGELCVQAAARRCGLQATVLRVASVYGPGMHGGGMIATFLQRLSSGQPVEVRDGGRYGVDLVYVDDVVGLAYRAVEHGKSGIFNVGGGRICRAFDVAHTIAAAVDAAPALIAVTGEAHPSGFSALDISRAERELGYRPMDLEAGLRHWKSVDQLTNFSR
ncbi:NAD(P)-dependent oxidoreductase [Rhizobium sp. TRM95111]|uniref:NAD-dependent epimerase/dehydratase family protein n=1 Tax=Rhizobium alarense TaxID=2846851 RepID=UPI001F417220|nr:NAD(P)-dependent oxidoreductase [Rhizobium alarense]MCF3641811.1 NAD(P)-dependent oxidoreductase [Rhizobium alarense]